MDGGGLEWDAGDQFRFVQAVSEASLKHPNIPERPSTDRLFLSLQGGQFTITKADFSLCSQEAKRGEKRKQPKLHCGHSRQILFHSCGHSREPAGREVCRGTERKGFYLFPSFKDSRIAVTHFN